MKMHPTVAPERVGSRRSTPTCLHPGRFFPTATPLALARPARPGDGTARSGQSRSPTARATRVRSWNGRLPQLHGVAFRVVELREASVRVDLGVDRDLDAGLPEQVDDGVELIDPQVDAPAMGAQR